MLASSSGCMQGPCLRSPSLSAQHGAQPLPALLSLSTLAPCPSPHHTQTRPVRVPIARSEHDHACFEFWVHTRAAFVLTLSVHTAWCSTAAHPALSVHPCPLSIPQHMHTQP